MIEMTIKGLMVDPITNMPIIILRDSDGQKVLPIWVGIFEANAIALQIENIETPRPMTHDLLRNVIQDGPPLWNRNGFILPQRPPDRHEPYRRTDDSGTAPGAVCRRHDRRFRVGLGGGRRERR